MTRPLVFRRVRVFDGERLLAADTVVVEGERIMAVGWAGHADVGMAGLAGAEVVDGGGTRTLLPGLIDAHVHALGQALRQALRFGVTTELDMANSPELITDAKARQDTPEGAGLADLRSAGAAATVPGGHGTRFVPGIPTLTEPEQADAFVASRVAEGSDYIKIHYDDGQINARLTGAPEMPVIRKETMAAVAGAAADRGLLSVAHVATLRAAREAIEAGVRGLAHIFVDRGPDPEFGGFAADRRVFAVPTLLVAEQISGSTALGALADDPWLLPYLADEDLLLLRTHASGRAPGLPLDLAGAAAAVRALHAAGVPVLAGTDAVFALHGSGLHRELELLVEAGLRPHEALTAATAAPAGVFGLTDRGRIAPGLRADLLLVEDDPLQDIRATRSIVGVWKRGTAVERPARHSAAISAP